jgi:RNA polymerase sigma-54 factor
MRMSFGLDQRQIQTQKMSPRMIQSMEILQLPLMQLQERIEQELAENPVLEMLDRDPALPDENLENELPTREKDVEQKEILVDEQHNNADDFERLLNLDRDVPDYFDERPRTSSNRLEEDSERQSDAVANIATRPESLQDHLTAQLGELDMTPEMFAMCERIISCLDAADGGYLRTSLPDMLPPDASKEQLELAKKALAMIQSLDPTGIAARDLKECLLMQLTPDMEYYAELKTLINNHLEDLRDNRLPQIQKAMKLTLDEVREIWSHLRHLNPKPGAIFAETHTQTVEPDVFVERNEDGTYRVFLEETHTPQLHISEYYRRRLQSGEATAAEKEFIKRKVNAAMWLIESIEQRRSTLLKVAQSIVDYQIRFLEEGPEFIEPLKMQQIADKVNVHVTTVSRAVDDKWIQTPRGLLALRKFFVGGTKSEEGDEVAWDIIRIKLQDVVDKEDKQNPLSDDDLVIRLKEVHGLNVARRTITKYRMKMGIPSSRQRRDWSKK